MIRVYEGTLLVYTFPLGSRSDGSRRQDGRQPFCDGDVVAVSKP